MVYRDRTNELHSIIATLRTTASRDALPPAYEPNKREKQSQFFEFASSLTFELQDTADMLEKLTKLIQQRNVFEDHQNEIQEMCIVVKQKLGILHNDVQKLQSIVNANSGWKATQADKHSTTVVNTLRTQLMETTQQFKAVLQTRTTSLKETSQRRSNFTQSAVQSALFSANQAALEDEANNDDEDEGFSAGPQLMMAAPSRNQYFAQRTDAVREIESTIGELHGMFQDFARIVAEQEDLILRIDDDVETALVNVEKGQMELGRYLQRISGNRGLILKVFGVIFFFIIFFGLFILK